MAKQKTKCILVFAFASLIANLIIFNNYGRCGKCVTQRKEQTNGDLASEENLKMVLTSPNKPSSGIRQEKNVTSRASNVTKALNHLYIDCEKEMPDLDELWERLVIVTAFSQNHIDEACGMIASVQKHMPGKRIIVYDLGIKETSIPMVKGFCGVELRKFNFSKYPPHTANLHTYAFKVFIYKETLHEFGVTFWGDASARFTDSLRKVLPYVHLHHGLMTHIHSYDPKLPAAIKHQFYFNHPKIYDELGVNRDEYFNATQASPHICPNRILFVNNSVLNEKIIEPLTECALREECIAPKGSKVGTHRFDASAFSLIAYKNLRYEWTPENHNTTSGALEKVVTVMRATVDKHLVKSCNRHH